jgi:glycosyltransferase involved in cell wall biosynthesis
MHSTQNAQPARQTTVAIVMANYNHARYLGESLGGIASQTRPADEIILIDDGSEDQSAGILGQFAAANPAVRFLRNEHRLGVHEAMSRAMSFVKSDYVVWTAADDRLLPCFLERSMAALRRHPTAGLCFSETSQLLGDTGATLCFAKEPSLMGIFDLSDLPEYLAPAEMVRRMKRAYLPIAANTVVVKREALLNLRGYPRELEWHADSFAYSAIALRHGACVVPETLALIRTTPGSYSHSMNDPAKQTIVLARMLDLLATSQYQDIRRIFRACPSNFSPGLGLMLRVQFRRIRDWDLFLAYLVWKIRQYKREQGLNWAGMLVHFLRRLFPKIGRP